MTQQHDIATALKQAQRLPGSWIIYQAVEVSMGKSDPMAAFRIRERNNAESDGALVTPGCGWVKVPGNELGLLVKIEPQDQFGIVWMRGDDE